MTQVYVVYKKSILNIKTDKSQGMEKDTPG